MITVTGLTKHYGDRIAVDDLGFDLAAGRVTGFVGPNGAGKSTTMRMMVGLTRPDRGEVRYDSIRYGDLEHPARTVGSVLDARSMHPGRTARNHLRASAALSSIPTRRVDEVLADVGLESVADDKAGGFSLGMRQRLALATALLGDPGSSCWTNRPTASTPTASAGCGTTCAPSRMRAARSSCRATSSPSWPGSPTTSSWSAPGGSSPPRPSRLSPPAPVCRSRTASSR
jgi:ABC-type transport system involved in cytochrome c biogenesis ATPase subunit